MQSHPSINDAQFATQVSFMYFWNISEMSGLFEKQKVTSSGCISADINEINKGNHTGTK
jgi:hypothetical protein